MLSGNQNCPGSRLPEQARTLRTSIQRTTYAPKSRLCALVCARLCPGPQGGTGGAEQAGVTVGIKARKR